MSSTQSNWYVRFGCLAPIIGIAAMFYFIKRDAFLPGFIFSALFFGFAILFLSLSTRTEEKLKASQKEYMDTFQPKSSSYFESHSFIADDLLTKIAVDERNRRIHFWEPAPLIDGKRVTKAFHKMPYILSDYPYSALLAVEVYENGTRQQTVVNEAAGTMERIEELGQSVVQVINKKIPIAKKAIHRRVANVELKIIIDDETKPVRIIRFYANLDKRLRRDSKEYIDLQRQVDHWVSLLTFIMNNKQNN
ncbi:hypothetical protein M3152_04915 [Sporosarcina luteola]|uniref:hypothetical protein n=1 Tax=Sporosarcina luteola TaxID=582850 RepID=UPI00203CAE0F|nr:hypothetical protein [Sporosarcina luteola]MCM3637055.1 hypothetical protein [Sporosarcina luteola]